jgi:hypothetical protein
LALNAKGGEINRTKAKGPHHYPVFKIYFTKGEKLLKGEEIITKTLLTAKGRTSSGELLFS